MSEYMYNIYKIVSMHVSLIIIIHSFLSLFNEDNVIISIYISKYILYKITASRDFKSGLQNCDIDLPSGRQ